MLLEVRPRASTTFLALLPESGIGLQSLGVLRKRKTCRMPRLQTLTRQHTQDMYKSAQPAGSWQPMHQETDDLLRSHVRGLPRGLQCFEVWLRLVPGLKTPCTIIFLRRVSTVQRLCSDPVLPTAILGVRYGCCHGVEALLRRNLTEYTFQYFKEQSSTMREAAWRGLALKSAPGTENCEAGIILAKDLHAPWKSTDTAALALGCF